MGSRRGAEAMIPTAARSGLLVCHSCSLVSRETRDCVDAACSRCGAALHRRKPDSLLLSWILLAMAIALYVPANVLPVIESGSLFGSQSDTILSGARFLWDSGDWLIATIIFVASIVLPVVKIVALAVLLVTAQRRSRWRPRLRARVYQLMEAIGRWSMVDIFVAAILVALVQFKTVTQIQAGPGAIAFAAVVVLTMFAAMAFDPRLIWDPVDGFGE
jgi:paraquat-inducible protein A